MNHALVASFDPAAHCTVGIQKQVDFDAVTVLFMIAAQLVVLLNPHATTFAIFTILSLHALAQGLQQSIK